MRLRTTTLLVFLGVLAFLGIVGSSRLLGDPDTFWHIAVGRQILATGALPTVDQFTYSATGQTWIANQWLAECLMAATDAVAGFDGLVCVAATLLAAVHTWIAARFLRAGAHPGIAILAIALLFGACAYNMLARPHLSTLFLLSGVFALLVEIDSGRKPLRALWLLPAVFLLWGNLHGGVLGGLGTVWLVMLGWILFWQLSWPSPLRTRRDLGLLILAGAGCGLVLWMNPYGSRMFAAWKQILDMDLPHLVIEHQRLDPRTPQGLLVVLVATIYFACAISACRTRVQVTWWLPAVWCLLALSRIRHAPLFASVAMLAMSDFVRHSIWSRLLARRDLWRFEASPTRGSRIAASVAVAVPLMFFAAACVGQGRLRPQRGVSYWAVPPAKIWPDELRPSLEQLARHSGNSPRVFNDQLFGGFLIYHYPDGRVFIDGRCELFGEPFLRDYVRAQSEPDRIQGWLALYPCDAALTQNNSSFDQFFREQSGWRQVQIARTATLHVRQELWPGTDKSQR